MRHLSLSDSLPESRRPGLEPAGLDLVARREFLEQVRWCDEAIAAPWTTPKQREALLALRSTLLEHLEEAVGRAASPDPYERAATPPSAADAAPAAAEVPVVKETEPRQETPALPESPARRAAALLADAVCEHAPDLRTGLWLWPRIVSDLEEFDGHEPGEHFPALDARGFLAIFEELGPDERTEVLETAFLCVRSRLASPAAPEATPAPGGEDLKKEWNALHPVVRRYLAEGFVGWLTIRERMFAAFGSIEDANTAIERINAYYGGLLAANFPPHGPADGRDTPVHAELHRRLQAALACIESNAPGDQGLARLRSVGGFSIRENGNQPDGLGKHSFGWAIDLDPSLNPNLPRDTFPRALVAAYTGLDVRGPASERLRTPRPYGAIIADASSFVLASQAFVAAFASREALAEASQAMLQRNYGRDIAPGSYATAFAAAQRGDLAEAGGLLEAAGLAAGQASEGAQLLVVAADVLRQRLKVKHPKSAGTAATIAAFGFVNLPATAIAALIASDGGGLFWRGATATGAKNFMHFELFEEDRPKLYDPG